MPPITKHIGSILLVLGLIVGVLFVLQVLPHVEPARAATRTATTCNQPDVQAAIDAAADGDTVQIPAGSCTWTTNVGWMNKNIILQGTGIDQTIITADGSYGLYIATSDSAKGTFRITGMTFTDTNPASVVIAITTEGNPGIVRGWRVDHLKFNYSINQRNGIIIRGVTYGLIDHNQFNWGMDLAIHIAAYNASDGCSTDNPAGGYIALQPV